jgi:hypothetical protein
LAAGLSIDLLAAVSPESVDSRVLTLVERVSADMSQIAADYSKLGIVQADDPDDVEGGNISARTLRSDASLGLIEIKALLTGKALTPANDAIWRTCPPDDVCIGV